MFKSLFSGLRLAALAAVFAVVGTASSLADNHDVHVLHGQWNGTAMAVMIGDSVMHGPAPANDMKPRQTAFELHVTSINGPHVEGRIVSLGTGHQVDLSGVLHKDGRGIEFFAGGSIGTMRITGIAPEGPEAEMRYHSHEDDEKGVAVVSLRKQP